MAINNYDGFLKYKQDNGDIAVLYPKTKVANVEDAATAASVTALDTRVKTLETGAHNPPQLYISDTEPEAIKARDWWFDTSAN